MKRIICLLTILIILLSHQLFASLPGTEHRCAMQVSETGDLTIEFEIPQGVGITVLAIGFKLNNYSGLIEYTDIEMGKTGELNYFNEVSHIDTDGSAINNGFDIGIGTIGNEYQININPELGYDDWSTGSETEEWQIIIHNLGTSITDEFQLDIRLWCNIGTPPTGLQIADITPCSPFPQKHTITTQSEGLQITVNDTTYTSPQTFTWLTDSVYTIEVDSIQNATDTMRMLFTNWSDAGNAMHEVDALDESTEYIADFDTQNYLKIDTGVYDPVFAGEPEAFGTNWYNDGDTAEIWLSNDTLEKYIDYIGYR